MVQFYLDEISYKVINQYIVKKTVKQSVDNITKANAIIANFIVVFIFDFLKDFKLINTSFSVRTRTYL